VLGVYNHPAVANVVLVDDFGALLANKGRPYSQAVPDWLAQAVAGWKKQYDVPLEWGGMRVGRLAVSLDTPGLAAELLNEMALNAGRTIGAFFALAAILVGIFHITLTRPLLSINRDLSRMDPSDSMGGRVPVPKDHAEDEIGLLARSINRLFQRIEEDIQRRKRIEMEIRQAKNAAEEANKSKSEFLANMSHEVRTPLNAILGMTDLTLRSELTTEQRKNLEMAYDSGQALLRVMNDILDLSKVDAGIIEMEREEIAPAEIAARVVDMFRIEAKGKGVGLSVHAGEGVPKTVIGDGGRLRQVLFNLVGNAIKFTDKGQVEVRVERLEQNDSKGAPLRFSVVDTGLGVPTDMQEKIFESFTQIDGTYSRKYQGAGLGLAIVNRFVELMGGEIHVESEIGRGSTFSFILRMPEVSVQQQYPEWTAESENHVRLAGLKALLAEDNPVNQIYAVKLLEGLGLDVTAVNDGAEAMQALKENPFDVAVLDIQMPGMDGLAVARALRHGNESGMNAGLPLVAMTAHAMKGDREKFLASGMDDYVAKPVDEAELQRVLVRVLARQGSKPAS
jgi:signal transduction histidine kinase/CheY-like chemotaxis protein